MKYMNMYIYEYEHEHAREHTNMKMKVNTNMNMNMNTQCLFVLASSGSEGNTLSKMVDRKETNMVCSEYSEINMR
jgi:hypothetical protein